MRFAWTKERHFVISNILQITLVIRNRMARCPFTEPDNVYTTINFFRLLRLFSFSLTLIMQECHGKITSNRTAFSYKSYFDFTRKTSRGNLSDNLLIFTAINFYYVRSKAMRQARRMNFFPEIPNVMSCRTKEAHSYRFSLAYLARWHNKASLCI